MDFHKQIEQIHVYRKEYGAKPILSTKKSSFDKFTYYIDEKSSGKEIELGGKKVLLFQPGEYEISEGEGSEDGLKEIWASGTILDGNSSGRFFRDYLTGRDSEDGLGVLYKVSGIGDDKFPHRYFTGPKRQGATKGKYYQGVPTSQLENPDEQKTLPMENFLDLAANFGNCRSEGGAEFRSGKKPEVLLHKLLGHFSEPGDWVLDSFAGSGTTGAVAQKMGRQWIMVELGEHCHTHVIPRLSGVIEGKDQTGITKTENWKGGGGFRYQYLAPSLITNDKYGQPIINKEYNPAMLAEAMCKLMGFTYEPNPDHYWIHGHSSETDFIYVTTNVLTHEQLKALSEEVGTQRTLFICCKAFKANADVFENLTIRKIPQTVLTKCEWGKDDYSLNVANLQPKSKEKKDSQSPSSFDEIEV